MVCAGGDGVTSSCNVSIHHQVAQSTTKHGRDVAVVGVGVGVCEMLGVS